MRAALDAGRTEEFREIAEQLRTASAAVGARSLQSRCAEAGTLRVCDFPDRARVSLATMENEFAQTKQELESYLKHG